MSLTRRILRQKIVYLFIAPYFILFLLFDLFPFFWSFVISLHEWTGLGRMKFVGFENYRSLFSDGIFLEALLNTTLYWLANVLVIIPLALFIASLLNASWLKGGKVFQTALFVPYVTAAVAAGLIFYILFDHDAGLVNSVFRSLGLAPRPWLISTKLSKIPVMLLSIWRLTPWYMLIIYSGLKSVEPELYEASVLEGAKFRDKLFRITIPMISSILFFCFITLSIDSFRIFTEPYSLTAGGPGTSSLSLVQYLYNNGFHIFKLGYASSLGYSLTFLILFVSSFQLRGMIRRNREMAG